MLTAAHNWEVLRRRKTLILMIGEKTPYRIDATKLTAFFPPKQSLKELDTHSAPDIAFIPLNEEQRATIEAKQKIFYSIDRRTQSNSYDLYADDGMWVAVGAPMAMVDWERHAVGCLRYLTDVGQRAEVAGWDYVWINLNLEANAPIPHNLVGMSGGGLWRVRFSRSKLTGELSIVDPSHDIILSGIIFLQTALDGRQLVAHGPKSVYEHFPRFLAATRSQTSSS
jgi:hypothetical protein